MVRYCAFLPKYEESKCKLDYCVGLHVSHATHARCHHERHNQATFIGIFQFLNRATSFLQFQTIQTFPRSLTYVVDWRIPSVNVTNLKSIKGLIFIYQIFKSWLGWVNENWGNSNHLFKTFPFGMKRHFLDHIQTLYDMIVCPVWMSNGMLICR